MSNLFILVFLASIVLFVIGFFNPKISLFWDKKEKSKKKSAITYSVIMAASLFLFGIFSDDLPAEKSVSKTENIKPKKETPIEQKIAALDDIYDPEDIKVIRIKTLLEDLSERYSEPMDTIAEYTFRAKTILHDKGIAETNLNILEQMKRIKKMENVDYKNAIVLYLAVRSEQ